MKKYIVLKSFVHDLKDLKVNDFIVLDNATASLYKHYNYIKEIEDNNEDVVLKNVDIPLSTNTVKVTKRKK